MNLTLKCPWPSCALALLALSCVAPQDLGDALRSRAGEPPRVEDARGASPGDHHFCGWLYGDPDDHALAEEAYDTFAAHADELDAVHPVWWRVASTTSIVNHGKHTDRPYPGFHDARVIAHTTPGGGKTKLVPLVGGSNSPDYVYVHEIINDPALRAAHVRAVVALAVEHGYDGVDIDYEHLDREHLGAAMKPWETEETERRAFSAFIADLSQAMHAAGKTLSLAVPADAGGGGDAYDYDALSAAADQVHLMGYDYHFEGGPHVGPVAPLGWIEDVVSYARSIDGGRRREKFLLGVPNYGIVGRETDGAGDVTLCETSARCAALAGEAYSTESSHMKSCSLAGHSRVDPGRTPNAVLPSGDTVFFDDVGSLEERVLAAERGGLGGIAYWSMGGEPEAPGPHGPRTFFQMVRTHFPR